MTVSEETKLEMSIATCGSNHARPWLHASHDKVWLQWWCSTMDNVFANCQRSTISCKIDPLLVATTFLQVKHVLWNLRIFIADVQKLETLSTILFGGISKLLVEFSLTAVCVVLHVTYGYYLIDSISSTGVSSFLLPSSPHPQANFIITGCSLEYCLQNQGVVTPGG